MNRAEWVCGLVAVLGLSVLIVCQWWPGVLIFGLGAWGLLGLKA